MNHSNPDHTLPRCNFCGKNQHEVENLIAGMDAFICDECVETCYEMIFDILPITLKEEEVDERE